MQASAASDAASTRAETSVHWPQLTAAQLDADLAALHTQAAVGAAASSQFDGDGMRMRVACARGRGCIAAYPASCRAKRGGDSYSSPSVVVQCRHGVPRSGCLSRSEDDSCGGVPGGSRCSAERASRLAEDCSVRHPKSRSLAVCVRRCAFLSVCVSVCLAVACVWCMTLPVSEPAFGVTVARRGRFALRDRRC